MFGSAKLGSIFIYRSSAVVFAAAILTSKLAGKGTSISLLYGTADKISVRSGIFAHTCDPMFYDDHTQKFYTLSSYYDHSSPLMGLGLFSSNSIYLSVSETIPEEVP